LPINDAGQPLAVELRVTGQESLTTPLGSVSTFKLEPRVLSGQRRDVQTAVWLTDDARHLPVLVEIAAGFGRLRVKLVDYRP
jgi:hypothetical protein